jgi:hypothetical protein
LAKDKPVKQEKYIVHGKYQYIIENGCPQWSFSAFEQVVEEWSLQKKYGEPCAGKHDQDDNNLE